MTSSELPNEGESIIPFPREPSPQPPWPRRSAHEKGHPKKDTLYTLSEQLKQGIRNYLPFAKKVTLPSLF